MGAACGRPRIPHDQTGVAERPLRRSLEIAAFVNASRTLYVCAPPQCGHATSIFECQAFLSERTSVSMDVGMSSCVVGHGTNGGACFGRLCFASFRSMTQSP